MVTPKGAPKEPFNGSLEGALKVAPKGAPKGGMSTCLLWSAEKDAEPHSFFQSSEVFLCSRFCSRPKDSFGLAVHMQCMKRFRGADLIYHAISHYS